MVSQLQIIGFALIGSLLSLTGGFILIANRKSAEMMMRWAAPFAAGALLAAAFGELLPELLDYQQNTQKAGVTILMGILSFFIFERFIRYFHHHHAHKSDDQRAVITWLVVVGDTIHNFIDGIAIGAAFLVEPSAGVVATIAVSLHEVPQEIGDFGLLLSHGVKKGKVIALNLFSALATVVGAMAVWYMDSWIDSSFIFVLIGLTIGFFVYFALSDIIPNIHSQDSKVKANIDSLLVVVGAATVLIVTALLEGISL